MRPREAELVEKIEVVPEADAVAVVAPGVVAVALGRGGAGRVDTETRAEGKEFDVVAESYGEPSALGPFILRPLVDRDVVVAAVGGQFHQGIGSNSGTGPSSQPSPRIAGRRRDPRSGRVRGSFFRRHRPLKTGLRFSMKAVRPSA